MNTPPQVWRAHANTFCNLGEQGRILFATKVHGNKKNLHQRSPYSVALVELKKTKERIFVQICQQNTVHIPSGTDVVLVPRKHSVSSKGLIRYSLKAKVVDS